MRRDIAFYWEAGTKEVYEAYLRTAQREPFERDCDQKPFYSIGFGVNYSMKYNMNGGACTIHFMPYRSGTAVNLRFSIAQVFGARYERYAQDLNEIVERYLGVRPREIEIDVEEFLRPENQLTPGKLIAQETPAFAPMAYQPVAVPSAPQPVVQPAAQGSKVCAGCGNPLNPGANFCTQCGTRIPVTKTCPKCHTEAAPDDAFCGICGTRL